MSVKSDFSVRTEELIDRFDTAWHRALSGEPVPLLEIALNETDSAEKNDAFLELLAIEFEYRRRRSENVDPAEYNRRFPEYSKEIAMLRANLPAVSLKGDGLSTAMHAVDQTREQASAESAQVVRQLDQYQILEKIGEGAFGTVFRALDLQLRRSVAIKQPKSSALTADEEARFLSEARSAADLDHPGIVRVYSFGRNENKPYIVSEYVAGKTLLEWDASAIGRDFRQIAAIFRDVLIALQHAHERGVIHRDLKPANIILEQVPNSPQTLKPRIMDFGLAKSIHRASIRTVDGVLLGTPAYMSPEQAQGDGSMVTAVSDVYSAGVMLYQMLTGVLPFRAGSTHKLLAQITDPDIEPISCRVLMKDVPRDLETVCLKCMEKRPAGRYSSAAEVAAELQRFLDGKPIQARRISTAGRMFRWGRRNSVVAGLSLLVLALTVAFAAHFILVFIKTSRLVVEKDLLAKSELNARLLAEKKKRESEEAVRFLQMLFQSSDPVGLGGKGFRAVNSDMKLLTAVEVVDAAVKNLNETDLIDRDSPVRASLLDTFGSVYTSLARYDQAEPLLTEALSIRTRLKDISPEELAGSYCSIAVLKQYQGYFEEAEQLCRRARNELEPVRDRAALQLATTELCLSWIIGHRFGTTPSETQIAEALGFIRDAVEIREKHLGPDHRDVGIARLGLGALQLARPETRLSGVGNIQRAFEILDDTDSLGRVVAEYMLAVVDKNSGRWPEAIRKVRDVHEKSVQVLGEEHTLSLLVLGDLAGLYKSNGQMEEAEKTIRQVLSMAKRDSSRWHPEYARATIQLGMHVRNRGDHAEAKSLFEEALFVSRRINHPELIHRSESELLTITQE